MEKLCRLGKERGKTPSFCFLGLFSFAPVTLPRGSETGGAQAPKAELDRSLREARVQGSGSAARAPQRSYSPGPPPGNRLLAGGSVSGRGRRVFTEKSQLGALPRAQNAPQTAVTDIVDTAGAS